jgi:putative selenate reductase
MFGIKFKMLLNMVLAEFERDNSVFSIPSSYFFKYDNESTNNFHGSYCHNPVGPAAGPHTQLAQNITALYLTGARIFELKTVQILDKLEFPKPCIDASRECYNTEWSTELSIEEAIDEYTKAFVLNYFVDSLFGLTVRLKPAFIFDMSVGYDLKGIKSEKVDNFLNTLSGLKNNGLLEQYTNIAYKVGLQYSPEKFKDFLNTVPDKVSVSVTLSTMHGCPVSEIEDICTYLLREKGLHTCLKLNPTLLGYDKVINIFQDKGYTHIEPEPEGFNSDLQFNEAKTLIDKLQKVALNEGKRFSVKLTNTLPVKNKGGMLKGESKYLSGKPLFLLTLSLAGILAKEFDNLNFSFSGGVDSENAPELLKCGIAPVTVVTDLLKPNGLKKFFKLAKNTQGITVPKYPQAERIEKLVENVFADDRYTAKKEVKKSKKALPLFDCFKKKICGKCVDVCPNRANLLVKTDGDDLVADYQILHISQLCNECGNCGVFCPYSGLPYKDKVTYYFTEKEFESEVNDGFFVVKTENGYDVVLRLNRERYAFIFNFEGHCLSIISSCSLDKADKRLPDCLSLVDIFIKNYQEYYE